jgi:nitrogenase molybdenum-iron protein alpha/beta subunit
MTPEERKRAIEVECDRTKARLDKIEAYLTGDQDAWIDITVRLPDTVAEVTVDKAIGEARQLALALATMTKTLATLGEEAAPAAASVEDALAAARKKREDQRRTG